MPKKFTDYEVHVEVYPEKPWFRNKNRTLEECLKDDTLECQAIVSGIVRHVDNVQNTHIIIDREHTTPYM